MNPEFQQGLQEGREVRVGILVIEAVTNRLSAFKRDDNARMSGAVMRPVRGWRLEAIDALKWNILKRNHQLCPVISVNGC